MIMHARAGFVVERFGHESGAETAPDRQVLNYMFRLHRTVGGRHQWHTSKLDLTLAGSADLMVMIFQSNSDLVQNS